MSTDTALYGVRWENGDIELAGDRPLAECLGGMFDGTPAVKTDWGRVTLMSSSDAGTTWTEVTS